MSTLKEKLQAIADNVREKGMKFAVFHEHCALAVERVVAEGNEEAMALLYASYIKEAPQYVPKEEKPQ